MWTEQLISFWGLGVASALRSVQCCAAGASCSSSCYLLLKVANKICLKQSSKMILESAKHPGSSKYGRVLVKLVSFLK